jgi:hypothetical protein
MRDVIWPNPIKVELGCRLARTELLN